MSDKCVLVTFDNGTKKRYPATGIKMADCGLELYREYYDSVATGPSYKGLVATIAHGHWNSAEIVDGKPDADRDVHVSLDHNELKTLTEHLLSDAAGELYNIFKRTWK